MHNFKEYLEHTSLIEYNRGGSRTVDISSLEELSKLSTDGVVKWVNTYDTVSHPATIEVVTQNKFDDFLINLIGENISNKVIELDGVIFIALEIIKVSGKDLITEKMAFIANADFVWSIQEQNDDDFHSIRERLQIKNARILRKKADYLLFLLLECIIDNYQNTLNQLSAYNDKLFENTKTKPTPEFMSVIEDRKAKMFKFKKSTRALRDNLTKLEQIEMNQFNRKYFNELKEQANDLIGDVDFELQELESQINLIFSIQGHHLNEVMKTLTIFSILFTPLSFLAGIYGMNFEHMPELKSEHGYHTLIAVMCAISITIIFYFKRKNWF